MGKVRLFIQDGQGNDRSIETATEDDFHYFRDSIQYALEPGGYGSRFPTFQERFPGAEWKVEELPILLKELEAMAEEMKKLPPEPQDGNWSSKLAGSGRKCESLYDVFIDSQGRPLLGRILDLCRTAQREGKPLVIE